MPAMKRKRQPAQCAHVSLQRLMQRVDNPFEPVRVRRAADEPPESNARNGRTVFTLHSKLASHLTDAYARQRKKDALSEVAAASREKGVTYPVALESPDGTVIDMMSLVVHTGARFLSRNDLCSAEGPGGIKPLCPPDADEATKQRYASEATAALIGIMTGSPPAALPLEAIVGLLEQAQYFGAVFIVTILPYYFQPLTPQLTAFQASEVLGRWLCAVQGAEATHTYKELVQLLAPAITAPSVSVVEFLTAAQFVTSATLSVCGLGKDGSGDVQSLLLELVGGLAEFQPVSLALPRAVTAPPHEPTGDKQDGGRVACGDTSCDALMCLLFAAAACATCSGRCGGAFEDGSQNGSQNASVKAETDESAGAKERTAQATELAGDSTQTPAADEPVSEFESPAETLQRCITRCCSLLLSSGGHLREHATAALSMCMQGATMCSCRSAATRAMLDRRTPLQLVASGPCNRYALVARAGRRSVLAAKVQLPQPSDSEEAETLALSCYAECLPSDWAVAMYRRGAVGNGDEQRPERQPFSRWYLGLHNLRSDARVLNEWRLLFVGSDADLHASSMTTAILQEWVRPSKAAREREASLLLPWQGARLAPSSTHGGKVEGHLYLGVPLRLWIQHAMQTEQRQAMGMTFAPGQEIVVCLAIDEKGRDK